MPGHGRDKYFSPHLAQSDEGQASIKEGFWKSYTHGSCYGRQPDHPKQRLPFEAELDLEPLRTWVKGKLATGPKRWKALLLDVRKEVWVDKHLNAMIRTMRHERELDGSDYPRSFNPSNNPRLRLPPKQRELFSWFSEALAGATS